jgi:hypothetical protein
VSRRSAEPEQTLDPQQAAAVARAYWRSIAIDRATIDCCVLNLIPWDDRALRKLPDEIYHPLLRKLDQLIADAVAREEQLKDRPLWLQDRFTAAIWDFLRPWSKNPNVPQQYNITQEPT